LERKFLEYSFSWNDSFIGTKVLGTFGVVRSRGTKVPRERMFHGTKVLGTFAPEERKFHRSESSKERMFHGTKVPRERKFSLWTFHSQEWKCRWTKRPGIVWSTYLQLFSEIIFSYVIPYTDFSSYKICAIITSASSVCFSSNIYEYCSG